MQPFGSLAIKHVTKEKRSKVDPKGEKAIFVGYDKSVFRLFHPETQRIITSPLL